MPLTGTFAMVVSASGVTIQSSTQRSAELGIEPVDIDLPPGKNVTNWVKIEMDSATCNLPAGHGYTSGQFDVYWNGGIRYDIQGEVSGNALELGEGGAGDDFPATATQNIVVCKQQRIDVTFDGDNLVLIAASASRRSHIQFLATGEETLAAVEIGAGEAWAWVSGTGASNPLAGAPVVSLVASNGSSAGTSNFKLTGLQYAA